MKGSSLLSMMSFRSLCLVGWWVASSAAAAGMTRTLSRTGLHRRAILASSARDGRDPPAAKPTTHNLDEEFVWGRLVAFRGGSGGDDGGGDPTGGGGGGDDEGDGGGDPTGGGGGDDGDGGAADDGAPPAVKEESFWREVVNGVKSHSPGWFAEFVITFGFLATVTMIHLKRAIDRTVDALASSEKRRRDLEAHVREVLVRIGAVDVNCNTDIATLRREMDAKVAADTWHARDTEIETVLKRLAADGDELDEKTKARFGAMDASDDARQAAVVRELAATRKSLEDIAGEIQTMKKKLGENSDDG